LLLSASILHLTAQSFQKKRKEKKRKERKKKERKKKAVSGLKITLLMPLLHFPARYIPAPPTPFHLSGLAMAFKSRLEIFLSQS
jgi:hypothetical protein